MSAKNKKNVLKKCLGRSCAQAVTFKTKRLLIIQKKKRKERKRKNINSSRCLGSFCKPQMRTHTHTHSHSTHTYTHTPVLELLLQSLVRRLVARGSPRRARTPRAAPVKISTTYCGTKVSHFHHRQKVRPQTKEAAARPIRRELLQDGFPASANGEARSTPTWRAGELRPFIINYSIERNMWHLTRRRARTK